MGKPWSQFELGKLRALRNEGHKPSQIAVTMGRTLSAIKAKIHYLTLSPQMKRHRVDIERSRRIAKSSRDPGLWNSEQISLLLSLRNEQKKSWEEIAAIMGQSYSVVYSKHYYLTYSMTIPKAPAQSVNVIPERVYKDRLRRQLQSPRDLTAAFMGDPLPGYSALERRT